MSKDLYGNFIVTAEDIARGLINNDVPSYKILHDINTKQGFMLYTNEGVLIESFPAYHGKSGCYAIFRDDKCLSVGQTGRSVGTRLSRFVKELYNKSRSDENYPAAKKMRLHYGSNLDDITIKIYLFEPLPNIKNKTVEAYIKSILKPLYNKEMW